MAKIYYCDAEKLGHLYEKAILFLPNERQEKAKKLADEKDRLLSAAAGLMVMKVFGKDAFDRMSYGEHGKPFFEKGPFFSISHSGKYSVLAVSENEIGVDFEMREKSNNAVMKRCFSEEEQNYAKLSMEKFFRIWTAKEAVIKLMGTGFSYAPKKFSVVPLDIPHEINGIKIRFFCEKINDFPITAAYCGDNDNFTVTELLPEDLIY